VHTAAVISVSAAWLLTLSLNVAGARRWQGRATWLRSIGGLAMFTGALTDLLIQAAVRARAVPERAVADGSQQSLTASSSRSRQWVRRGSVLGDDEAVGLVVLPITVRERLALAELTYPRGWRNGG